MEKWTPAWTPARLPQKKMPTALAALRWVKLSANREVAMPVHRSAALPSPRPPRPRSALEVIPGVGASIAHDLEEIGITRVAQLRGADPQALYASVCTATGVRQDRCLLYVFRCAVYFASTAAPDPEKLKWWNWKDSALPRVVVPARMRAAMHAPAQASAHLSAHASGIPPAAPPARTRQRSR
jgi:hypothetical protein